MGLENREYLREDFQQPSDWRPSRGALPATTQLILVMIAVYILQLATIRLDLRTSLVEYWLQLDPEAILRKGQIWRLLTYAFCHSRSDLLHLVINSLTLHFCGQLLLGVLPRREFLWFFLAGATFSGIASLLFCWLLAPDMVVIGASGAVLAALTLAALYFPRQQVLLMGFIPLQMRWLLAAYVAWDLLPILTGGWKSSQTAHIAHLGGVMFGGLYFQQHLNFSRWWNGIQGRVRRRKTGKLKIYAPSAAPESRLNDQVDAILQKITDQGEASLTPRERNILTQASRQLRKQRGGTEEAGSELR
ncbi:MAG: rhomboid family intramembrane serine protease [Planctomycetota bacterium]